MRTFSQRFPVVVVLCVATVALAGCGITNPYVTHTQPTAKHEALSPAPAGEPVASPPVSAQAQNPEGVQVTQQGALAQFTGLYVNWSWRTLTGKQRRLAQISTGSARLSEQQAAAASAGDTTISQGQIFNTGAVLSIGLDQQQTDQWVVVTREQTGGNTAYDGVQAALHVYFATLTKVTGGWVVSSWQPQD
jgi:hypothetical protein